MSKVQSGLWGLLLIALGIGLAPRTAAAQAVTGTISGTVVDQQGSVIPGATVTIVNEATNETRVSVTDARGDFQVTNLQPGRYTVRVELESFRTYERKNVVLSAGERLAVGNVDARSRRRRRDRHRRGAQARTSTPPRRSTAASSPPTQIEQMQVLGRDVTSIMRLLPGVRYENTVDSLGMSFGTDVPNVGGARRDWSNVIVDGVVAQRGGQQRPHGAADQPRRDRRGPRAAELLSRRVRARRRRPGADRQQGGGANYRGNLYYYGRHETLNANDFFNNRTERQEAALPLQHLRRQPGRPGAQATEQEALLLLLARSAAGEAGPGRLRNWTMPTDAEMRGDFSQTLDSQGRLINIRDPLREGACNAVTGGPACFPGNIIPANRINSNGLALLNMLPRANNFDRTFTQGQFNYTTQENAENPKMNNIVRVDWRPTANDSFYFTFKDWYSDQRGSEITAGPAKWGFFNTHYLNTDRGGSVNYTKILRSNLVLDTDFGIRQQTEQFYPLTEADWDRINRDNVGFTVGQFHPELNPRNVVPKVNFNVPNSPNFTFDNRLVDQGEAWLTSIRSNLTLDQAAATRSRAGSTSSSRATRKATAASAPGRGPGSSRSAPTSTTRFDTNYSFANALLGTFRDYTRDRRVLRGRGASATSPSSTCRTRGRRNRAADGGLRRPVPLVHAVVLDAAGGGVRARAIRSGQGAAALPAGA